MPSQAAHLFRPPFRADHQTMMPPKESRHTKAKPLPVTPLRTPTNVRLNRAPRKRYGPWPQSSKNPASYFHQRITKRFAITLE